MGIKFFFKWLKKTFPSHIRTVSVFDRPSPLPPIHNFLVDMNGIIHYCCQKVYKYGQFEEKNVDVFEDEDLGDEKGDVNHPSKKRKEFGDVATEVIRYLERIIAFVRPTKTIFLAIDGVAPLSKQFQQRSRRFRSSSATVSEFDSNSITPGTQFLHDLSNTIHHWITRKVSREWSDLTVLFSSEKAPGEGEHKLVKWVREFGNPRDSFMMQGMDADLVMLSLATHFPHFHILRDNNFRPEKEFFHISVESLRNTLITGIMQDLSPYTDINHINDFIVMIFLTGNDFLPTIPTIELLNNGADYLFAWYRTTVAAVGPLTNETGSIRPEALSQFLYNLSTHETHFLEQKRSRAGMFPDRLLEAHTRLEVGKIELSTSEEYDPEQNCNLWRIDFPTYRTAYYREKLGVDVNNEKAMREICKAYLEGIQWVLGYYLQGVPHWKWAYPYLYAPFLSDVAKYALEMHRPEYTRWRDNAPFAPLLQLVCVLPRKSSCLLPDCLTPIFDAIGERGYPDDCEVDLDGKMHDWEGVVKLPTLPWKEIEKTYRQLAKVLNDEEIKRNRMGRTFEYKRGARPTPHALSH